LALALMSCASASGDTASGDRDWALQREIDDGELNWGACPEFFPAGCQIAVLHGDPGEPNADIFFRIPGGYRLPNHRHTSAERMVLLEGALQLTYEGQRAIDLAPGTYVYGPPGSPHSGICVSRDPCVLFIAFESAIDAFATEARGP